MCVFFTHCEIFQLKYWNIILLIEKKNIIFVLYYLTNYWDIIIMKVSKIWTYLKESRFVTFIKERNNYFVYRRIVNIFFIYGVYKIITKLFFTKKIVSPQKKQSTDASVDCFLVNNDSSKELA